ncbi:MAG: ATP phosphoribosyltransferase [Clostridiales bacterium]|jgi:ATP phosphoribosyltransferase|nr:ATP phosphoribosyltransferase [Clostridiales bacterium]
MITIALAKGRLAEQTIEILGKCGIDISVFSEKTRKLVLTDPTESFRVIFVKPADVPVYIENGIADIGVCGSDTLLEEDKKLYELLDLGFAKCRLCIAGYAGFDGAKTGAPLRVASKYENITKNYYHEKGENVQVIKLNGSVELGPVMGLSDVILDIVESGSTLRENGLAVLQEICPVSARLVANKVSLKTKSDEIKPLVAKIKNALETVNDRN